MHQISQSHSWPMESKDRYLIEILSNTDPEYKYILGLKQSSSTQDEPNEEYIKLVNDEIPSDIDADLIILSQEQKEIIDIIVKKVLANFVPSAISPTHQNSLKIYLINNLFVARTINCPILQEDIFEDRDYSKMLILLRYDNQNGFFNSIIDLESFTKYLKDKYELQRRRVMSFSFTKIRDIIYPSKYLVAEDSGNQNLNQIILFDYDFVTSKLATNVAKVNASYLRGMMTGIYTTSPLSLRNAIRDDNKLLIINYLRQLQIKVNEELSSSYRFSLSIDYNNPSALMFRRVRDLID